MNFPWESCECSSKLYKFASSIYKWLDWGTLKKFSGSKERCFASTLNLKRSKLHLRDFPDISITQNFLPKKSQERERSWKWFFILFDCCTFFWWKKKRLIRKKCANWGKDFCKEGRNIRKKLINFILSFLSFTLIIVFFLYMLLLLFLLLRHWMKKTLFQCWMKIIIQSY